MTFKGFFSSKTDKYGSCLGLGFAISILEKRVISTIHKFLFGKTCCHNDS
jgi:hypothetical protein